MSPEILNSFRTSNELRRKVFRPSNDFGRGGEYSSQDPSEGAEGVFFAREIPLYTLYIIYAYAREEAPGERMKGKGKPAAGRLNGSGSGLGWVLQAGAGQSLGQTGRTVRWYFLVSSTLDTRLLPCSLIP